jgi:hypothetical protein
MLRVALSIVAPWVLVWTFISTFFRGVKDAAWFAWNDCAIEFDQMHRAFKANSMNPEDWKY